MHNEFQKADDKKSNIHVLFVLESFTQSSPIPILNFILFFESVEILTRCPILEIRHRHKFETMHWSGVGRIPRGLRLFTA